MGRACIDTFHAIYAVFTFKNMSAICKNMAAVVAIFNTATAAYTIHFAYKKFQMQGFWIPDYGTMHSSAGILSKRPLFVYPGRPKWKNVAY